MSVFANVATRRSLFWLAGGLMGVGVAAGLVFVLVPMNLERLLDLNKVLPHTPFEIREEARILHDSLTVADWHTDTLMWLRDPLEAVNFGQVDVPRLRKGNVAVQVFTSVTRVPDAGTNLQDNKAEGDQLWLLAVGDSWPAKVRNSLFERSAYQAARLFDVEKRAPEQVKVVLTAQDLEGVLEQRGNGQPILGAILGTEGLHPLERNADNVQGLYDRGYRVMGLHHFFDNELGGSLHGESKGGLTAFGRQVIGEMNRLGIIVDVAHSSHQSVKDALALSDRPVILSHTGMRSVCDTHRNIPDELMLEIAQRGGLVGIGYWETAICGTEPRDIVDHLRHAIDLLGVEHVSLGSDYDGTVTMPFDVSEVAILTQTMLDRGFTKEEIRAVMGGNMVNFLLEQLPGGGSTADPNT